MYNFHSKSYNDVLDQIIQFSINYYNNLYRYMQIMLNDNRFYDFILK